MFHFFEKVNEGHLKIINVNYKNSQISLYCQSNKIIKGRGTSFQSPTLRAKIMLEIFFIKHTSI